MNIRELMGKLTSMVIADPTVGDRSIESVGLTLMTPTTNPTSTQSKPLDMCSCLQYRQTKNCDHLKAKLKEMQG